MTRLIGLLLIVVGGVLLYLGWRAHESVAAAQLAGANASAPESVWFLALGAIGVVWGLFTLLRRTLV